MTIEAVAQAPATVARPRLGARPALDGLRGAAVLAVLGAHTGQFLVPGHGFWPLKGGFLGVDVFLVLSGFLITALLLNEVDRSGGLRLRRFYGRRATRLLPALLFLLAAHWIYTVVSDGNLGSEVRATVLALTFSFNWHATMGFRLGQETPLDLLHLWTLSVEGQFYLVWPLALLGLMRAWSASPRRMVAVVLGIVLLVAVVRGLAYASADDWSEVYNRPDTRLDSLFVGAALAILWSRGLVPGERVRRAGAAAGAAILVLAFLLVQPTSPVLYYGGFITVVAVAAALILVAVVDEHGPLARAAGWRPLRGIGLASYSLYLLHLPIFVWAVRVIPDQNPFRVVVAYVATAALTTLCYLVAERPVMARRGRLRRTTTAR